MTRHPRREVLWQVLAACSTALFAPVRPDAAVQDPARDRAARVSAGYLGDQAATVRAVGEAYLRQLGRDQTPDAILAAARGTMRVIDRARDEPAAFRDLSRAVRQDFEKGRTIQLEGWILSRTEAEICVLLLLGA